MIRFQNRGTSPSSRTTQQKTLSRKQKTNRKLRRDEVVVLQPVTLQPVAELLGLPPSCLAAFLPARNVPPPSVFPSFHLPSALYRPVASQMCRLSLHSLADQRGQTRPVAQEALFFVFESLGFFLSLSLFLPPCPTFGCTPANSNTHGMLGIVQQMPLGRTFLSGTTSLFTLFILEYLSPAPTCQHFSSPASDKFPFLCKSLLLECICGALLHF